MKGLTNKIIHFLIFFSSIQNEEWYYPRSGGARKRIHSCGDCGYKAVRSNLVIHAQRMHPSSTSALPPTIRAMRKQATLIHKCTECDYATNKKRDLDHHRGYHDEKSAHQCPWCSFSVGKTSHLTHHVKRFHTKLDKKPLMAVKKQVFKNLLLNSFNLS